MTNKEAIQRVLSLYSRGPGAAAARLSRRHVWNKLVTVRERLIVQQINKNQKISQWSYQTVPCVEMIPVPEIECPCVPPVGYHILRSKHKLPAVMTSMDKHLIQSVTSLDGSLRYDETRWESKKYRKGGKYTASSVDYFIKGDYLWLTATRKPEKVTITVLGSDPIKWALFGYCCDSNTTPCVDFLSLEFPIEAGMFDALIELTVIELVEGFARRKEDREANGKDDVQ